MPDTAMRRGRPRKYREFEKLLAACPAEMRRPRYCQRIGVRRGQRGDIIWVKIQLPYGSV